QMWHVTLPGIRNTIMIMLIMQIGRLMNVGFEKVFLLQNPLNTGVSEVISTYVYKQGILNSNFSYSTAVGLFNSVISFSLILISNTISRKYSEVSLW
ncbi:MAG: sugar ABC transporter permease, partial [Clostridia bacterium]